MASKENKQTIILNKYLAGVVKVLPSGQMDVSHSTTAQMARRYDIADDVVVANADIVKMEKNKKKKAAEYALTPKNIAEDQVKKEREVIRKIGNSYKPDEYDMKRIYREVERDSLTGPYASSKRKDYEDDLKKLKALKKILDASAQKVSYDPSKIPEKMTAEQSRLFEDFLHGRTRIYSSGAVDVGHSEMSGGEFLIVSHISDMDKEQVEKKYGQNEVTVKEVEQVEKKVGKGLSMIEPPKGFWEKRAFKGYKPEYVFTDSTMMGKVAKAVLKHRMGKENFEKRYEELKEKRKGEKDLKKLTKLKQAMQKNGR